MTISAPDLAQTRAMSVVVSDDAVVIELNDGRSITAPIAWYPRLLHADKAERENVRLIGGGTGIHWPDVEEDISVDSVLKGTPSTENARSLKRWLQARDAGRPTKKP